MVKKGKGHKVYEINCLYPPLQGKLSTWLMSKCQQQFSWSDGCVWVGVNPCNRFRYVFGAVIRECTTTSGEYFMSCSNTWWLCVVYCLREQYQWVKHPIVQKVGDADTCSMSPVCLHNPSRPSSSALDVSHASPSFLYSAHGIPCWLRLADHNSHRDFAAHMQHAAYVWEVSATPTDVEKPAFAWM